MTFVQKLTEKLDQYLKREDNIVCVGLGKAEALTGISRLYLANSLIVLFISYMVFGQFAQLICNLIGFVYPAYISLVALNSAQTQTEAEQANPQIQHLLRYWVVFAFMSVADFFSGYLFRIVPFYWLAKMIFLIWCIAPIPSNGSTILYFKFIQPVFNQVQPLIDESMAKLLSQISNQKTKS